MLPHALDEVPRWAGQQAQSGGLILLLDFDGTLAPIVEDPADARIPPETRGALDRLRCVPGVVVALVSGRALADVRSLAGIEDIAYAGNHGMEIEAPGFSRIQGEAVSVRPALDAAREALSASLSGSPGSWVEDKGLTLSIHYRLTPGEYHDAVHTAVREAVEEHTDLHITEGKRVLEIRPRVAWDKGKAVLFLLEQWPEPRAPVLYLGDDRTDEDAFCALRQEGRGEGIIVADPPSGDTAATSYLRTTTEVGRFIAALADHATHRRG
jgi:trehalose 6-phosphate phosphatase